MAGSSLWWFGFAGLLALVMVVAMLQFTASLLLRRPRKRASWIDAGELEGRLLAHVFETMPVRITRAAGGGLEIDGYALGDAWRTGSQRVSFSVVYGARMALDERRRELRWYESVRSRRLFLGFDGWIPRFQGHISYSGGLVDLVESVQAHAFQPGFRHRPGADLAFGMNTVQLKHEVTEILSEAGWSFKPVTLPFFATGRWLALSERILPEWVKRVPDRWFWGTLYPASYLVVIACLLIAVRLEDPDAWNRGNLLITLLVSASWWGVWGLLAWILYALANTPRRSRARRAR